MTETKVRLDYDGVELDADLDAEDALEATKQRNRDAAIHGIRNEYYTLSDSLYGLIEISAVLDEDKALRKKIDMLMSKLDDLYAHLNKTYKWD
jgi:hypothetical protein